MITIRKFPNILIDVYFNGVYQETVNELGLLDLRVQICEKHVDGYSLRMNPKFYYLFDKEEEIEDEEHTISFEDGILSDWFPEYFVQGYGMMPVYNENITIIRKMYSFNRENRF